MIGVIGPEDSVALTLRVAAEMGLSQSIVPRPYQVPDQAVELAHELDAVCQVILFTGRVPYRFARSDGGLRATLQYVEHSGIDLYRSLVVLLRAYEGRLPALSIDTLEHDVVAEVWRDLALEAPRDLLPLPEDPASTEVRRTADVTAFHVRAWEAGRVGACLTCLRAVYEELTARQVPAFRVEHTRASVKDALLRAQQTAERSLMEAQQIAVGLLEVRSAVATELDEGAADEGALGELPQGLAARLHGRLQPREGSTSVFYTTWGALQHVLERGAVRDGPLVPEALRQSAALGFGLGATLPRAEENARRALALARLERRPQVVFADGTVRRVGGTRGRSRMRLRELNPRVLEMARQLRMNAVSFQRIIAALQELDARALTAGDLADALGSSPRGARRTLAQLQQLGIVSVSGTDGGPGAGRPRTLYRVHAEKLLPFRG